MDSIEPGREMRIAGRTQNLQEANNIAEIYRMQGYETRIIKKMQGSIALYEIWIGKVPDVFSAKR